jgi:hypothetical protein
MALPALVVPPPRMFHKYYGTGVSSERADFWFKAASHINVAHPRSFKTKFLFITHDVSLFKQKP